jgi:hypothetical protein
MSLTGQFYLHPVFNAAKSKELGRKIFDDKLFIEIRAKGDKNTSFSRPATDADRSDFARAWQHFTAENGGDEQGISGTPLRYLPAVGPSMVFELRSAGVHTIEDLLDLDDAAVERIRGGRLLVRQASAYMKAAEATAGEIIEPEKQAADEFETGVVGDDDFVSDLNGSAAEAEESAEPKRGPGRPRKGEGA